MTFTPEQEELRAVVRGAFAKGGPLWTILGKEIGATALAVAEEDGGFGASLIEVGVVVEEAGAALLAEPYLSTVVSAAVLKGQPILAEIASGERVATLALTGDVTAAAIDGGYVLDGVKEFVTDGTRAGAFVVSTAEGLFLAEAPQVVAHETLDTSRPLARCVFTGTPAAKLAASQEHALQVARALLAVESVGVARASLAMTADYLKTRKQFGVPLASFQALRHRVADLYVRLEAATSAAWYALRAVDSGAPDSAVAARIGKLVATEAAYAVTAEAIQLHGGIGFTWEHPAHRYFKRATANRQLFGDPATLRAEIAALAGL